MGRAVGWNDSPPLHKKLINIVVEPWSVAHPGQAKSLQASRDSFPSLANMRTIINSQLVLLTVLGILATRVNALAVRATNSSSSAQATESSTTVSVTVPSSYDSSDTIDPNFPAFAFEEASFVNYVLDADGNTNTFSQNLIEVVTSRTGGVP